MPAPASAPPAHFSTAAAFFDWYRHQEGRYEYLDGVAVEMAGASPRHNRIEANLVSMLRQTEGRGCLTFPAGQMISVKEGTKYRHADCSIVCGEPRFDQGTLVNPTVLIEVLSNNTEGKDRGDKWREYRRIPSLCDYLLVAQRRIHVDHFQRRGDLWVSLEGYSDTTNIIQLADGTAVPVSQIYEGVWDLPSDE